MNSFSNITIPLLSFFFFFNDPATTEISPLSLHDPLPISAWSVSCWDTEPVLTRSCQRLAVILAMFRLACAVSRSARACSSCCRLESFDLREQLAFLRSEEHTSELQPRPHLGCRSLL